jgi:hypothetical protein
MPLTDAHIEMIINGGFVSLHESLELAREVQRRRRAAVPVEADILREAHAVVEAENRSPSTPGSHGASRARLARALLALVK